MNKDVIYIEPEDDITDIITKIENSKEKIIALVPPKKASVFRSIVNIKLIAKAGVNASKTVVLVTTDPSIVKLAGVTKLPVTKNLQSAPVVPESDAAEEIETTSEETVIEAAGETEEEVAETIEEEAKPEAEEKGDKEEKSETEEKKEEEKAEKEPKEKKKVKKSTGNWLVDHKKWLIFGGIGAVVLVLILVWAFGIAPAADVTVAVRTTTTNFSESATFTNNLAEENVAEGKFYLTEKKIENKTDLEFEATGKKNVGEKATGSVVIYAYFTERGTRSIEEGATFANNGLKFVADDSASLSWDGTDVSKCENSGQASAFTSGCLISGRVSVTASAPGEQYNIAAASTGWTTTANVGVYSDSAMAGGSDKTVTIVQQSDIEAALAKVVDENASTESARKAQLMNTIEDGSFVIESSYKEKLSDPVSSPKVGEEVEEGKKATLSVVTTDSIYIIDKTKVEEFISEKAKLADNYKIYEMNDPFIENFTAVGEGYIGKIKTSFVSGPKVAENDVIEVIKGKGLGEARAALLDAFSGIDSNKTKINVSYPWVFSIPSNPTKITVTIEVEE
ncbi:hypothetical protein IJQ51_01870 [Candidatus Saccharibacteria bacterium]|nr:hypothetical protein [Candidatus Saccharibacteria bacterium]